MADYIEREAADKALTLSAANDKDKNRRIWAKAICVLHDLPAADVAPVVHGRWVWREDDFEFECSACKCGFDYNKTYELFDHGFQFANYCPNCGVKMDKPGGDEHDGR